MTFGGKQKLSLQHRMQSHLENCSNMFCTADVARIYGEPMISALVKKAIILLPSYHHCILKLVKTIPKKTSNKDCSHRSSKKANSLSKFWRLGDGIGWCLFHFLTTEICFVLKLHRIVVCFAWRLHLAWQSSMSYTWHTSPCLAWLTQGKTGF
jgi:hypothetical protein